MTKKAIDREIVKDIPKHKKDTIGGTNDGYYQWTKSLTQKLHLDSLESGFDSLQIRIWLGHSMAVEHHLVNLCFSHNRWKGKLITFEEESNKDSTLYIRHKREREITPKNGWDKMFNEICRLNILTLKHSEILPKCNGCGGADGITYAFEIATTQHYRYYYYCNPDKLSDKCREAENVLAFANFLENEFGFKYAR